jgi:hypothetical protein
MINLKQKEKFIELRAEGISLATIAKRLKISKQTAINLNREYSLDIRNIKSLRMEALYEKYRMLKEGNIEYYCEILKKIRKAIRKRNLSDQKLKDLVELEEKYSEILKNESEFEFITDEDREREREEIEENQKAMRIFDEQMQYIEDSEVYNTLQRLKRQNQNHIKSVPKK